MKDSLKFINTLKTFVMLRDSVNAAYPHHPSVPVNMAACMQDPRLYSLQDAVKALAPISNDEDNKTFTFADGSTMSRAFIVKADPDFGPHSFYHPANIGHALHDKALEYFSAEILPEHTDASLCVYDSSIVVAPMQDDAHECTVLVEFTFYLEP